MPVSVMPYRSSRTCGEGGWGGGNARQPVCNCLAGTGVACAAAAVGEGAATPGGCSTAPPQVTATHLAAQRLPALNQGGGAGGRAAHGQAQLRGSCPGLRLLSWRHVIVAAKQVGVHCGHGHEHAGVALLHETRCGRQFGWLPGRAGAGPGAPLPPRVHTNTRQTGSPRPAPVRRTHKGGGALGRGVTCSASHMARGENLGMNSTQAPA